MSEWELDGEPQPFEKALAESEADLTLTDRVCPTCSSSLKFDRRNGWVYCSSCNYFEPSVANGEGSVKIGARAEVQSPQETDNLDPSPAKKIKVAGAGGDPTASSNHAGEGGQPARPATKENE